MLKAKAPSPLPYLITAIVLLVGGYRWFHPSKPTIVRSIQTQSAPSPSFSPPSTVPTGTVVKVDGSTSMVTLNQNLKQAFERQFPGTQVLTQANGSSRGIQDLLAGQADIAATSRPLTATETQQGLQSITVANDAIAIVVGQQNPFRGSLTPAQVRGIFLGIVVNWSQVGGPNKMIRVINRPAFSGTHQTFKEQVLQDSDFGTTTNITTLPQDATTPLLRALGDDGIGYATAGQVINQQTVRVVPILDKLPDQSDYLYQRPLYYVYRHPPNPAAQAFLGFVLSPQGQHAMVQKP
jgi:phosphate transport system substrate-binding protein